MVCYHQQCLIQTALREEELMVLILDDEIAFIIWDTKVGSILNLGWKRIVFSIGISSSGTFTL